MISLLKKYFSWLKKNAPEKDIEVYPIVSDSFETNIPGIYIIGDLTGVPLLKFAAESGKKVWKHIPESKNNLYDAIIIGAGPSGVSAAIEGNKLHKKTLLLESNSTFQTIVSYPKGKPIYAEPKSFQNTSELKIHDGTKETLLANLKAQCAREKIEIRENSRVVSIESSTGKDRFKVKLESGESYDTNNVIIAIGKSGDPRRLNIKGEDLPHVSYRLLDPSAASEKNVIVVGGGDSALEAAIAMSEYSKSVTLVYRGSQFTRVKAKNIDSLNQLVSLKKIKLILNATVSEILPEYVIVRDTETARKIPCDYFLIQIGSELPIPFLKKIGIKIQNSKTMRDWIGFVSVLSFASSAYFGKSAFYGLAWFHLVAYSSIFIFITSASLWLSIFFYQTGFKKPKTWNLFRNLFLSSMSLYFLFVYLGSAYFGYNLFGKFPSFHYTFIYSLTILFFGIRRMIVKPTDYIKLQTITLILVQWLFLFLLPEIFFPYLGKNGFLGDQNGFILTQIFPNESYWKAYGFILLWPLSIGVLYDGSITTFWMLYGLSTTFIILPILVYQYGKGAYCGWICSCGGLAETLGDEHRHKMPHSKKAYLWEHSGQVILLFAFILTFLKLLGVFGHPNLPIFGIFEMAADSVKWLYDLIVDILLAGVIGVGSYFFLSGRIWCRMFCPLASLMHIYARFSKFRIFSDKKKCISCNICSQNCHQGIDVMSYANLGRAMDSVQCVRCSACVSMCPTNVLSFGKLENGHEIKDKLNAHL
ncbi:MAG: NAD(P)-binding domain-containing protein [Leptospira sp.]|nr:NAD(P)-binding domain-containing protein [Leptospira sp.]